MLTQLPHSAAALRGILTDFLDGLPVDVESCVGRRLDIPAESRAALGVSNSTLGVDCMIGARMFDRSATFGVRLGPMTFAEFDGFLPGGDARARIREIVDLFNTDGYDYVLDLRLRRDEVPPLRLGAPTARLGWSAWLGSRPGEDPCVPFVMKGRFDGER